MRSTTEHRPRTDQRRKAPRDVRGTPRMPSYLSPDEMKAWGRFAEILGGLRVVNCADFAAFEALTVEYVLGRRLRAALLRAHEDDATWFMLLDQMYAVDQSLRRWLRDYFRLTRRQLTFVYREIGYWGYYGG